MPLSSFEIFLKSLKAHPFIDASISKSDYIPLDLSIHNSELKAVNVSSSDDLERFIWKYMKSHNAKVAYGGYLERRGIYQRSDYFNQSNPETERNIHLGIDFWVEAETPIYSPLEGTIHSFKNNTNHGDYGPAIILKHCHEDIEFCTLYGHLSLASLEGKQEGDKVDRGEQIATLGTAEVNGDYPPHLHFQIINDIQEFSGDYPGVCNQMDLAFYRDNCPDPNVLLDIT